MATTPTNLSFFFLLFTLIFLQLHARESQFFSKFSNHNPIEDDQHLPTTIQPQQQDQNFIPQTTDSRGYGLYGQLPPSTTTLSVTNGAADNNRPTTLPENYNTVAYTTPVHTRDSFYDTTDQQYANKNQFIGDSSMYMNHQKQEHLPPLTTTPAATNGGADTTLPTTLPENYNTVAYTTPIHSENSYETTASEYGNKDQYYSDDNNMYNSEKQGMSDTRVLGSGKYNHVRDMYNSEEQRMDKWDRSATNDGNMYNTEKQGMSDTRYMDNGRYYYDLNGQSSNSRAFGSKKGYNSRGYYGNDDNSNIRYNSNVRFQENQEYVFTP